MATYFYMRISTQEDREMQKYSRQEHCIKQYANENKIPYDEHYIYKEDISGKNFTERKEWIKLERVLHSGDTVVFKDISRFTREAQNGYDKYMDLMRQNIHLVFLDNPTVCTDYIKQLLDAAEKQTLIAKISLENTVKLLLFVELDRAEQERLTLNKRIKDGMAASSKKPGRKTGQLDKMTPELSHDLIAYSKDRSIRQIELMRKHNISRNTLKKYVHYILAQNEKND